MLTRRNYNQTNQQHTSSLAYESLSPTIGKDCASTTIIDRKISLAIDGLKRYVENWLRIRTSNENALTISEYILLLRREINPSQNYTILQIQALVELSEYLKQKPFKQTKPEDILSFLDKFRKTESIPIRVELSKYKNRPHHEERERS